MAYSAGNRHLIFFFFWILAPLLLPCPISAEKTSVIEQITLKSSPDASEIVIKASRRPVYKVIRIEKEEFIIAFRDARFSNVFSCRDIRDAFVADAKPAHKQKSVMCINIKLSKAAGDITHCFDEKTLSIVLTIKKDMGPDEKKSPSVEAAARETEIPEETIDEAMEFFVPGDEFLSQLLTVSDNDGKRDTALFVDAVDACKGQWWKQGRDILRRLLRKYPEGRYAEKASFLQAECYRRLHSDNPAGHFEEIITNYRNAIQGFPDSLYIPAATFMIAKTHFKMKNYHGALAQYDRLWSGPGEGELAAEAGLEIGEIYLLLCNYEKAISVFRSVLERYPQTRHLERSKVGLARALFEIDRFEESLSHVKDVYDTNPGSVYEDPHILICMGNDYYQMGQYDKARDILLRAINIRPDVESNDLTLARIADAYYELGARESARKFYNLAIEEHPKSNGALISSVRLVTRYEDMPHAAQTDENRSIVPAEAYRLYQDMLENHPDNPMLRFLALKIARWQRENGRHQESINTIKNILESSPATASEKDILQDSYKAFFTEKLAKKDYLSILTCYESDKKILDNSDTPEIFLLIGNACVALHFYDSAHSIFQMADRFFFKEERPPELLFGLGESLFGMGDFENACKTFIELVRRYPDCANAPIAYYRTGLILLEQKKYDQAKKNFDLALSSPTQDLPKAAILADRARAMRGMKQYGKAIKSYKEAAALYAEKKSFEELYDIYLELGEFHIRIGDDKDAAGILESAMEVTGKENERDQLSVMLTLAGCYQRLNRTKDALDLCERVSAYQDTLWGRMAAERIMQHNLQKKIADSEARPGS